MIINWWYCVQDPRMQTGYSKDWLSLRWARASLGCWWWWSSRTWWAVKYLATGMSLESLTKVVKRASLLKFNQTHEVMCHTNVLGFQNSFTFWVLHNMFACVWPRTCSACVPCARPLGHGGGGGGHHQHGVCLEHVALFGHGFRVRKQTNKQGWTVFVTSGMRRIKHSSISVTPAWQTT